MTTLWEIRVVESRCRISNAVLSSSFNPISFQSRTVNIFDQVVLNQKLLPQVPESCEEATGTGRGGGINAFVCMNTLKKV